MNANIMPVHNFVTTLMDPSPVRATRDTLFEMIKLLAKWLVGNRCVSSTIGI